MTLALGESFFTPENEHVRRHLWVVVSDPQQDRVAIANFSTSPSPHPDPPEVRASVAAGEHPSLIHDSFIRCERARVRDGTEIEHLIRTRTVSITRTASPALVTRIQAALTVSENTPLEVKELLHSQRGQSP